MDVLGGVIKNWMLHIVLLLVLANKRLSVV